MMTPEIRREMLRLFVALEYGEQLAHQCAFQQASWVSNTKVSRFLKSQARQERSHARFFSIAANSLQSKHHYAPPAALKQFATRLEKTITQRNLTESMVGSQIVLEGFGEQILLRLNQGLDNNGVGFKKIRHILLRQEQSHYAFGMHTLKAQVENRETTVEHVCELTNEYKHYVNKIVHEMAEVFYVLDEDPENYTTDLVNNLPSWIRDNL